MYKEENKKEKSNRDETFEFPNLPKELLSKYLWEV